MWNFIAIKKPASEIVREYGISHSVLYKRIKDYLPIKVEDKVKFINENKSQYDVRSLCKILKIHHSAYCYHCNHKENSYYKANQELNIKIR